MVISKKSSLLLDKCSIRLRSAFVLPSFWLRSGSVLMDYRMNGLTTDLQRTYNGPATESLLIPMVDKLIVLEFLFWKDEIAISNLTASEI